MTTATIRHRKVGSRPPSRLPEPDLIADDELAGLLAEYSRQTDERRSAEREIIRHRDDGPAARKRDARDQGAAARDGKPDPGDAHERKRLADMEAARSRVQAVDAARLAIAKDIQARRVEARNELLAGLDEHRADLDGRIDDAIETLTSAIEDVKAYRQLRKWIEPDTLDVYSPPRPGRGDPPVKVGGRLGGMAYEPRQVLKALADTLRS